MKKSIVILIDGENINRSFAPEILKIGKQLGRISEIKVYHRQCDPATKAWTEISNNDPNIKDICLYGPPAKNKVDHKIIKDARKYFSSPNIRAVCIVTSDSDFRSIINLSNDAGKQLFFIGESKAPERLRNACDRFIELRS